MSPTKFTDAPASFTPEQLRALHEVVALLSAFTAGHASLDAALTLSAIKARAGELDVTDFVATVEALAPEVSVPSALLAWLSGGPEMLPPAASFDAWDDDAWADFDVRR